jgi:2-polyprenyl-3-methyl-5-hydroxy-6-metoxy-1,4-benzoquinol methylase
MKNVANVPYIGQELDIFAHAANWKKYWASEVKSYLSGDVLEVGAGLGTNTEFLKDAEIRSWVCLEPDADLASLMRERFGRQGNSADCQVEIGTLETLSFGRQFDAIVYIDVLEHIDRDREELLRASKLLRSAGKIVVLAPAHQWLYSRFDRAIGHWRRYNKKGLLALSPAHCKLERLVYLDSAGMLASIANRLFLRQSMPNVKQILFWDRYLIQMSRLLDRLTFNQLGKSILAVWEKS